MSNVMIQKSEFTINVSKRGGKILAVDPITVKNQIQEIKSIDDLPGVNKSGRVDGATFVYNANTNEYDVKQISVLSNLDVSNITLHKVWANGSSGAEDQVLASNGTQVWWQNAVTTVYAGNGLSGGGKGAANVVLSLDTAYVANNVTAYNATRLNNKQENQLSVGFATLAVNSNFSYTSNNAFYLNGKTENTLQVQFAVLAINANFAYTANVANFFGGQPASYYTNASNMSTGTLPNERIPILDGGFY